MEAPQTQPEEPEIWTENICLKREFKRIKISLRSDKQFGPILARRFFFLLNPPFQVSHYRGVSSKQFTGSQDVTELMRQKWMSSRG